LILSIHNAVPALYRHEAAALTAAILKGLSASAFNDPQAMEELNTAAENIIEGRGK
jgi:hypothetical protein